MSTRVFVWAEGLASNLGDSVLRRGLLRRFEADYTVRAFVGDGGDGYLSGLETSARTVPYSSEWRWHADIMRSALVRRTVVLMSPGEAIADRRSLAMRAAFVFEGLLVRLRGGAVHQTGVGIRRPAGRWSIAIKATSRVCGILTWRDEWSRSFIGRGEVFPDWAMGEGPRFGDGAARRDLIALSFRGDRSQPDSEDIRGLATLCAGLNLRPVVVAQVAADDGPGRALAAELDCDFVEWGSGDHAEVEARVRAVYARARFVLSDRVHGLIIAATEGAIPIPFGYSSVEKAERTLHSAGLAPIRVTREDVRDGTAAATLRTQPADASSVLAGVGKAAERLDDLASRLLATLGERPLRVLHSMAGPDGVVTRYADHMAAVQAEDVTVAFFSWHRAIFGRYDVFHMHWPEYLARGASGVRGRLKAALMGVFLLRLRLTRTPVVWTMHNLEPHEAAGRSERERVQSLLKRVTATIALNPSQRSSLPVPSVYIPHGHYKERFAKYRHASIEPGRVLYFGLIRPYKNVPALITAFSSAAQSNEVLSVVGKPKEEWLRAEVEDAVARTEQVELDLRFVEDEDLVAQVTRAQLIVLPYLEMNNSGALFVALSLGRPVLVPRSPVNEAVAKEVGSEWMLLYDGDIDAETLREGLAWSSASRTHTAPAMNERDWEAVGRRHRELYRTVTNRAAHGR